jgi:hypothetical protein
VRGLTVCVKIALICRGELLQKLDLRDYENTSPRVRDFSFFGAVGRMVRKNLEQ